MEPIKPSVRQQILANNPDVREEEIDEYQQLQAAKTMRRSHPQFSAAMDVSDERLRELHEKLFGTAEHPQK